MNYRASRVDGQIASVCYFHLRRMKTFRRIFEMQATAVQSAIVFIISRLHGLLQFYNGKVAQVEHCAVQLCRVQVSKLVAKKNETKDVKNDVHGENEMNMKISVKWSEIKFIELEHINDNPFLCTTNSKIKQKHKGQVSEVQ